MLLICVKAIVLFYFFFRRNKSNFRDDQTNSAVAQSSLNSNDTTHPSQSIRRYYFDSQTVNLFIFYFSTRLN